jgi:phosphatidylinositol-3-phosphatase
MTTQQRSTTLAVILAGLLLTFAFSALRASAGHAVIRPGALAPNAPVPAFKHIFVIVLENKEYEQVLGSAQASYFNSLAQQYGLATNYYGIRHPSLPNYLALTGGDTFGITSNCTDCTVAQPNLVDQLEASGKSWKAYMEAMPRPCFVGDDGHLYRQKHNPFIYYDNVRTNPARCAKIVPFTQFTADAQANALPNFVWITPNMCNAMHDCPLSAGDAWLKTWVPAILNTPAWKDNGALFITFDEGTGDAGCCRSAAGGRIATLVISPLLVRPGFRSEVPYTHYSLLHTIEAAWGLPPLGQARCDCATTMADFFTPATR